MDFSSFTREQINNLDSDVVKKLSSDAYYSYRARSSELGNIYQVGGRQTGIEDGKPYYGCANKCMDCNKDGNWEISVVMCGPTFSEYPLSVDEARFRTTMLSLGVSKEKIDQFIAHEVNWDEEM